MDWTLEVVFLPGSDIDAAIAFYRDQVGFELDHDTTNEHMHVAQLTPRGSGCSIVVGDLPAQRRWRRARCAASSSSSRTRRRAGGADGPRRRCSEIMVFDERDGGTFFGFSDPDGNTWSVQQLKVRGGEAADPGRVSGPIRRGRRAVSDAKEAGHDAGTSSPSMDRPRRSIRTSSSELTTGMCRSR